MSRIYFEHAAWSNVIIVINQTYLQSNVIHPQYIYSVPKCVQCKLTPISATQKMDLEFIVFCIGFLHIKTQILRCCYMLQLWNTKIKVTKHVEEGIYIKLYSLCEIYFINKMFTRRRLPWFQIHTKASLMVTLPQTTSLQKCLRAE